MFVTALTFDRMVRSMVETISAETRVLARLSAPVLASAASEGSEASEGSVGPQRERLEMASAAGEAVMST